MPVTAESVVVEVIARLDKAEGEIKKLDATFSGTTKSVDRNATAIAASLKRVDDQSTASFGRMGTAAKRSADDVETSTRRSANATRNLGRQVADVGTQLSGGQSPFLIFAQQAPQVADALADTGGKAAAVASFFAGPWGAALLAAGSVLLTLVPRLLDAGGATDELTKAQIDLYTYVDRTTGAINRQTTAIQRLAAAQARQGDIEGGTKSYVQARGSAIRSVNDAAGVADTTPTFTAGGVSVPRQRAITDPVKQQLRDLAATAIRTRQPINDFALAVRAAVGDRPEYRALVKTLTSQAAAAVNAAQGVQKLKAEQAVLTGTATAQQRAILGLGQTTTGLIEKQVAYATATTATEKARAALSLVEERGRQIAAGDAQALNQYRADLTKANQAVNAAEAAERSATQSKRDNTRATRDAAKAERERARDAEKGARDTARAERELLALRSDLLAARSDLAVNPGVQDDFQRQRIQLDNNGRNGEVDERRRRGELSKEEADEQRKLIAEITQARLDRVDLNAAVRKSEEGLAEAQAAIGNQRDILQAQSDLATTTEERRDKELQILDLQIKELRLRAQRVLDLAKDGKASDQDAKLAQITLDGLPALEGLGKKKIERDAEGPLAAYRRDIFGDINQQIEGIEVAGLRAIEDSLLNSTKAALGLTGALGDVVGELIRIGIQRKLIGPLADALFGGATGGGGLLTSLLGSIFGGARASGGPVSAGKSYLVGERGPELLRMGGQSGSIVPNHSLGNISAGVTSRQSPPIVIQVTADEGRMFVPRVQAISGAVSVQIVQQAAPGIVRGAAATALGEVAKINRLKL